MPVFFVFKDAPMLGAKDRDLGVKVKNDSFTIVEKIKAVALPLCQAENFELVHLKLVTNKLETIVQLYLDKPGGIQVADCVYVSRQLGDLIDIHVGELGSYRLEVSSPGPRRPLNNKQDFIRFKGEKVRIETSQLIEDRKKFTGMLEMINDDSIVIVVDGNRIEISDHLIHKARLTD